MPRGQTCEAHHGEETEVKYADAGGFCPEKREESKWKNSVKKHSILATRQRSISIRFAGSLLIGQRGSYSVHAQRSVLLLPLF